MDASAFDGALGKVLRFCRLAADLELPVEEMLEYVAEAIEDLPGGLPGTVWTETGPRCPEVAELEALREIIAVVGEAAAIGSKLAEGKGAVAPPDRPQTAPFSPPERTFPLPANLREA